MPEYTGPALIPVHSEMRAIQKEIDKGKGQSPNSTEHYHCRQIMKFKQRGDT